MNVPIGSPAPAGAEADLAQRIGEVHWYHTLELGGGLVTRGAFDTRRALARVPLPASLAGRRCLDVGTWDGFWAFEMERRGAGEVVAIDLDDPERWDWPAGAQADSRAVLATIKGSDSGFDIAQRALGSTVKRVDCSVYECSPERLGRFDFVFMGSLLLHLRDPVGALAALRSVCDGEAVIADTVQALASLLHRRRPLARLEGLGRPWWWQPNIAGLRRMVESAGFEVLEQTSLYTVALGAAHPRAPLRQLARGLGSPVGRENAIAQLFGVPHAAVRARPQPDVK
ncbi:MAG TPA: methyltransferase domain-containing protein [Solirubrobacteraceae bacterium]|nr:methyltransferase domain-containing protein [Solirubrobacteraceae bacterium]